MTATAPVTKLRFLPRLESLRGLASVSVVGYHAAGQFIDTSVTGMAPVVMFFVLSGFVLARSLENDPRPLTFLKHRLFRLLPASTLVVLILALLHATFGFYVGYQGDFSAFNVVLNALMIHHDINGVMWSMTVECFATPLILISVWIFLRWGEWPLWGLILLLFGLSFWGPYVHLLGGFTNLAPLYAFVIGVLMQFRGPLLFGSARKGIEGGVAITAALVLCVSGLQKQTSPIIAIECASSAALLAVAAFRTEVAWLRILDLPLVRFFGRISYSFYLLHPLGLSLGSKLVSGAGAPVPISIAADFVIAVGATTPLAWLSWRLVELPFVALGKRVDVRSTLKPP